MSSSEDSRPSYVIGEAKLFAPPLAGALYLVATPIGNLGDVTVRALETLAAADVVYCEDTRITSRLLARYRIAKSLKPYHDHNAAKVRPAILRLLEERKSVALVSDAGMPLVSDPGFRLVESALAAGAAIEVVPGPSAPLAALIRSGLPTDRFLFLGFAPNRSSERRKLFEEVKTVQATLILFDSPHRVAASLADVAASLPDRSVVVARELTKIHEEVLRGSPGEIAEAVASRGGLKGEVTLLIAPPSGEPRPVTEEAIRRALLLALRTMPPARAAATVARSLGVPRRDVYARVLAEKKGSGGDDGDA